MTLCFNIFRQYYRVLKVVLCKKKKKKNEEAVFFFTQGLNLSERSLGLKKDNLVLLIKSLKQKPEDLICGYLCTVIVTVTVRFLEPWVHISQAVRLILNT